MEKENKNLLVFESGISTCLANAVRRYLNQVLVLAIDEVEISKNDSASYDETVAHRLGLIPIITPGNVGESTEKELKLSTKKEGFILSGELKGDAKVVYDNIPITLLNKGQELDLKGFVRAGKGTTHAKFSPGLMFYNNLVDVKVNNCPAEAVENCPAGVLEVKDNKVVVAKDAEFKADACEACVETLKKIGKSDCLTVTPKETLVINVESFGQLAPKDMLKSSISALQKDLEEVGKGLK